MFPLKILYFPFTCSFRHIADTRRHWCELHHLRSFSGRRKQRGNWISTYPGIHTVQNLIGSSPGGTTGHTGIQHVAKFSAVAAAAAAVMQYFPLPFLQPLGQTPVITSSTPGAYYFSFLAELCVPTFPNVYSHDQDEHKLQMLHNFSKASNV